MLRIATFFSLVRERAEKTFPWLSTVTVKLCALADADHRESWRQFAHSGHHENAVCYAKAAEHELTDAELIGTAAHELGHVVAAALGLPEHRRLPASGLHTPPEVQAEADLVASDHFGIKIRYNARTIQEAALK